ncbi:MAG: transporter substrate-binding domain-containing protein [Patescibacteria group bacterium]
MLTKKNKTIGIVMLLLAILVGCWWLLNKSSFSLDGGSQRLERPILVASGHPEWSPIMWQRGDEIIGVGPELVTKIFDQLGIDVSSEYAGTWDVVQKKAKSGEIDVLVAAYKTSERETYMDYSDAYTVDPVALFVKKGQSFTYNNWDDLVGRNGVATIGDSYGQQFDDFLKTSLTVERVVTAQEAFEKVLAGQADYFVYALYSGQKAIADNNYSEQIEILPKYVAQENFYITISKKSPYNKYLPQVNELIKQYQKDGTIIKLIKKYQDQILSGSIDLGNN